MIPPEQTLESAPSGDEPSLEHLVRAAAPAYLDDAGFTACVLHALPPDRRRSECRRLGLLWAGFSIGVAGAAFLGGAPLVQGLVRCAALLAEWSGLPVPGFGSYLTVGAGATVVLALVGGIWAHRQSGS